MLDWMWDYLQLGKKTEYNEAIIGIIPPHTLSLSLRIEERMVNDQGRPR